MARRVARTDADATEDAVKRVTRTVRHRAFTYTSTKGLPELANRGETIEVYEDDAERGDALGAFVETYTEPTIREINDAAQALAPGNPDGTVEPQTHIQEVKDGITDLSQEQLEQFVRDSSVSTILDDVTTPESAERVLDVEESLDDPRKTLVEPLRALQASILAAQDNNEDDDVEDLSEQEDEGE